MPTITPGQTLTGALGAPFSQTLSKTGAVDFWYTSGNLTELLPAGLSLNSESGLISGTPTERKSSSHYITAAEYLRAQKIARGGNSPVKLALKTDGSLFAWGVTDTDSALANPATPYLPAITGVVDISAGSSRYIALKNDGTVVAWHYNEYASSDTDIVPPAGLSGVVAVAAGYNQFLALKNDGTLVGWGYGDEWYDGIKNIPAGLSQVTAISVDHRAALALKSDGTVVRWGLPSDNHAVVPSAAKDPASPVIAISLSATHALALKADGSLIGWGDNTSGQLNFPSGLTNVIAIEALENRSIALKDDGSVVRWGAPFFGEGSSSWDYDYTAPTGVVAIRATYAGYLALKSDGTVIQVAEYPLAERGNYIVRSAEDKEFVNFVIDKPADSFFHDSGENSTLTLQAGEPFSAFPTQVPGQNDAFIWSAAGLPSGLSVNSTSGEIAGTPLQKGTITATITRSGLSPYSLVFTLSPAAPPIKPDQTISLIYGESKTAHLRNLLVDPWETYSDWSSFTLSGLPAWATFVSEGTTAGTYNGGAPPERGAWTVDITVTGTGGSTTGTFTLEVGFGPPIIEPGQAFTGSYLADFVDSLLLVDVANRPHGSFYVDTQAPIPPGLAVTGYGPNTMGPGRIAGTPTAAGFFTARIKPLNSPEFQFNDTDYETVTFDIAYGAPQITRPFSLPTGKVGISYSSNTPALTDAANRPVTAWSATGLPAWASFDETTGAITGTPQDTGSHTVVITATGPGGTDSVSASLVVAVGAPIITSGQSFDGKIGETFAAQVALEDTLDRPADTWSASNLPAGLTIDASTGEITGTPTNYGAFSASVTAVSAAGSDTKTVAFTITAGTPIITPSQSFSTKVGAAFSATPTLTDSASRPVTSWSATNLPGWLALDQSTGKLTGTPQDAETLTFSLTATGPGGSDTESVEVVVALGAPIIEPATFSGKVGEPFTGNFSLSDAADRPATEWAASNLPTGLTIDTSTGAISGTPTSRGDTVAVIVATGPGGTGVPLSVPFSVSAGVPIIATGQFFAATQGQGFSTTPSLTDAANRPVTSWSASGLPEWAVIDGTTGQISGTPTSTSPASLTLTATGPGGTSEPQTYIITVSASSTGGGGDTEEPAIPMISLVSGQSFTATLGQAFSATPSLLTGTATKWFATGLPDWATIDQTTGQITGNATYTGTATVLITVQEASGVSAADYISITAVSWNTLELYIDPRARKFLSKANSKYPLSKIAMKRYDRMPFQLAFVDGSTAFSVPSSYEVTVGLKKNYGDTTYLAYATNTNGVLELNTDSIEAVFADEPDLVTALFEVRWQDTSSAFRTATLAAEIQNSVIRGEGNPPPPPPEDQPPLIRLYGENPMTVNYGSSFTDPGARVDDDIDPARQITGTGEVNTNVVGSYTLTYTATDSAGNAATPITRTVNVVAVQPTYTAPTLSLSATGQQTHEIGTNVSTQLSTLWSPNDAGPVTAFRIVDGSGTVVEDASVLSPYQHDFQILANTTLTAAVDYAEGPQKYDSAGEISGTPIPAGTKISTGIEFKAYRAAFIGLSGSGVPYNSATVRAISGPLQGLAKGSVYTLNIPVGTQRIAVAYPATIGSLASVRYVEWSNYDVTDTFTLRSVSVAGANGAAPIPYNVYYYIPAIPFDSPATYVVTI